MYDFKGFSGALCIASHFLSLLLSTLVLRKETHREVSLPFLSFLVSSFNGSTPIVIVVVKYTV